MESPAYGSGKSDRLIQRVALLQGAERGVQSHRHEVRGHAVGGRVERLAEVDSAGEDAGPPPRDPLLF